MPYYYHAFIRVDGMLWHHSRSQPSTRFYISQPLPVFHNYGLTLALAGYIVDPDTGYVSRFGVTRYKRPVELFERFGVYAYPALVSKAILGEVLMAGNNEGTVMVRGQSRLAYPFFTKNVVLMPGSELETLIISEDKMPDRMVVRIGAKRSGVLRVTLKPVRVRRVEHAAITHPFNLGDVVNVQGYSVLLPHGAGDVAAFGTAEQALEYRYTKHGRRHRATVPVLKGARF